MRVTPAQRQSIKQVVAEIAGNDANVFVFGSRVDDNKRGGDLDLLVELTYDSKNSAWLGAQLSAKISRIMMGRKVDVLISASNLLELPIHKQAKLTGVQI